MAAPATTPDFVGLVRRSGLVDGDAWDKFVGAQRNLPAEPEELAALMVKVGLVTPFQAKHMLAGRHRGLILGQYKLINQIGKGGTGVVFLAEHRKLRRRVAIKALPSDRSSKESVQRFYREARAFAMLDHPNIIRAHDANNQGNVHYLVMEYVDGQSLKEHIERRGAIEPREAADYVNQVASGLQHAHERGLIHRDIKPANLLLDHTGKIKILDMGLVLFFQDEDDTLTQDLSKGAVLGTADYLSPEQALDCHEVDIRSDIYSLGATFYTLLNGRPPFHDSKITQKLIDHQIREPPPLYQVNPNVPRPLSDIVAKMMAKKPECRYQTPAEVIAALNAWLKGEHAPAQTAAPAPPLRRFSIRAKMTAAVLIGAVLAGAGCWYLFRGR